MMYWATSHQTATEIIYSRADAQKPHMGLTTWKNAPDGRVQKSDTIIAQNYLSDKEVSAFNRLSTAFLDLAELRAERQIISTNTMRLAPFLPNKRKKRHTLNMINFALYKTRSFFRILIKKSRYGKRRRGMVRINSIYKHY